ncbi:MAG: hypothetical protein AAF401_14810 [Pseudomonadota bacterium]
MKRTILLIILAISLAIAGYTFYESYRLLDPAYQRERTLGMLEAPMDGRDFVELDKFAELRPERDGTREIVRPHAIAFSAAMIQKPEPIETEYVYTALSVMEVSPMPKVGHRMFIESAGGHIMPVYVWDDAVAEIAALNGETRVFGGHHVYTYAKGPAIIVDGVI